VRFVMLVGPPFGCDGGDGVFYDKAAPSVYCIFQ
jgi:hypothetical protein